ncbi:hypothetical protein K469DRAFT_765612 [Zopfia rhizophila CBS 207.26]|uniref:Uncharacterized protein n=1 Tax=Zopfia rhizophila CBS 207.26 TaxID=1314779 RepID=A0A6A6D843_9PEZI|nr:hypothetical protein K469DRAFT_765612 [Zopfia rhizophila CBS 207.26]
MPQEEPDVWPSSIHSEDESVNVPSESGNWAAMSDANERRQKVKRRIEELENLLNDQNKSLQAPIQHVSSNGIHPTPISSQSNLLTNDYLMSSDLKDVSTVSGQQQWTVPLSPPVGVQSQPLQSSGNVSTNQHAPQLYSQSAAPVSSLVDTLNAQTNSDAAPVVASAATSACRSSNPWVSPNQAAVSYSHILGGGTGLETFERALDRTFLEPNFLLEEQPPQLMTPTLSSDELGPCKPTDLPGATIEKKIVRILECARSAGYADFDSLATDYYTAKFDDSSYAFSLQRTSRSRRLRGFLDKLRQNAQTWSDYELQDYRNEISKAAEDIYSADLDKFHRKLERGEVETPLTASIAKGVLAGSELEYLVRIEKSKLQNETNAKV